MKAKDLKIQTSAQLEVELHRLREELAKLSVKTASSQEKNVRSARKLRKDIARILTILTEQKNSNQTN